MFSLHPVEDNETMAGVGSVLLLPGLLAKPLRDQADDELGASRLGLRPVDQAAAEPATALGASHPLRAADAVHLAIAVAAGAERFLTNNRADFPRSITEVDVPYPKDLR